MKHLSPSVRKKRRSACLEECPSPVDINTPQKRRKKKKKIKREEESDFFPSDADGTMNWKEQEEEGSQVDVETSETELKKKKKKKKREQEEVVSQPPEISTKEKKRKMKIQMEQEDEGSQADMNTSEPKRKTRKRQEDEGSGVDTETSDAKKKRKRKKEEKNEGSSLADVETSDSEKNSERNIGCCLGGNGVTTKAATEIDSVREILVAELLHFMPDVKNKTSEEINKHLKYDLNRFRAFRKQGISLRSGRFTSEENQQLKDNVEDFLALTGISSANHLLFPHRFKEQEVEIKKLKIKHCFLEKLAEGIPRTCKKVYNRAIKLFDERNHLGRFSKEEMRSLVKLQNLHGNNWKVISQKMGRSFHSLEKRFSDIALNHGSWSSDEEAKLKEAVKGHLEVLDQQNREGSGLTRSQLCNNLPWTMISQQVRTRSWTQCRLKWFSLLKARLTSHENFDRSAGGLKFKIRLIKTLYDLTVDDIADVRWDTVTETLGGVTCVCVQKSFHRLKVSRVPNWTSLSFGEIVDFLWVNVVPVLKERLAKFSEEEEPEEPQKETTFQLSHIFSTVEEDLDFS